MARTLTDIAASRPKFDRAKIDATTEADIKRHAREDGEQPAIGAFTTRRPGQRGLGKKPAKVAVSLRIEPDILAAYKEAGRGWQQRVNDVLRKALKRRTAA